MFNSNSKYACLLPEGTEKYQKKKINQFKNSIIIYDVCSFIVEIHYINDIPFYS